MSEEGGYTSFTFKRKIILNDEDDFKITSDTVRILWSWNDVDPSDGGGAQYHGANRGIVISFIIFQGFSAWFQIH